MRRFLSVIDRLNNRVGLTVSYLVLFIMGVTLFEVISRFIFNSPTVWAHETTEQLFGTYIILAGGYALLYKTHIRIDVLWRRLSPRGKVIADLATCGFAFLFLGVLLWTGIRMAWDSTQILEASESVWGPPIFPLKIFLAVGALLIFLQLIANTVRNLRQAITGVEND